MLLLLSDTHLDDQPDNEYRWDCFEHVHAAIDGHAVTAVYHLGDFVDRKDRFASAFVNRLLAEIENVGARVPFTILKGNHDDPLRGPAFFEFVNGMVFGVRYITKPTPDGDLILLPFSPNPIEAWRDVRFADYRAAFLHVTPGGAVSENGFELPGSRLPAFPKHLRLYTGDVHVPQTIGQFTVVGCPHPIKFGDRFQPRMLLLDGDTFEVVEGIPIAAVRKRVIDVSSIGELGAVEVGMGDKARVRFSLGSADVNRWGEIEAAIRQWSLDSGVEVVATEVVVQSARAGVGAVDPDVSPETILRQFAGEEGVVEGLLDVGLDLLREVG